MAASRRAVATAAFAMATAARVLPEAFCLVELAPVMLDEPEEEGRARFLAAAAKLSSKRRAPFQLLFSTRKITLVEEQKARAQLAVDTQWPILDLLGNADCSGELLEGIVGRADVALQGS